jgi:hypothetical protein
MDPWNVIKIDVCMYARVRVCVCVHVCMYILFLTLDAPYIIFAVYTTYINNL